nr:dsc e3 ubiquitin ligase complex subunit 2 [Quercus suber]
MANLIGEYMCIVDEPTLRGLCALCFKARRDTFRTPCCHASFVLKNDGQLTGIFFDILYTMPAQPGYTPSGETSSSDSYTSDLVPGALEQRTPQENMLASGFSNAPVSKALVLGAVITAFLASITDTKYYFWISVRPHLLDYGQLWRLFTWQLCYTNSTEVLFAAMTLYQLRVIERLWGSKKFAVVFPPFYIPLHHPDPARPPRCGRSASQLRAHRLSARWADADHLRLARPVPRRDPVHLQVSHFRLRAARHFHAAGVWPAADVQGDRVHPTDATGAVSTSRLSPRGRDRLVDRIRISEGDSAGSGEVASTGMGDGRDGPERAL